MDIRKMTMQTSRQLNKRRERLLDWVYMSILAVLMIGSFSGFWYYQTKVENHLINVISALFMTLIASYPVVLLVNVAHKASLRYYAPSYWIEEDAGVLKVYGEVPLFEWESIKARLLMMRPNYRMENDAYERFGCTMAAVPASVEFLKTRREMAELGITI